MSRRSLLLLAALAVSSVVLVARRDAAPPATGAGDVGSTSARAARPRTEPEVDPATIRDVFRFAEPDPTPAPPAVAPIVPTSATVPPPPTEPFRLVGLVRREGKLLAAFALAGDVVLAGPGERVAGATVLEVGEDGVRIRRPDGSEGRLTLP